MPNEDSSGPAEKAVYTAYDAKIQAAFNALCDCLDTPRKKDPAETEGQFELRKDAAVHACDKTFTEAVFWAAQYLKRALGLIEKSEGLKIPKPKHKADWY